MKITVHSSKLVKPDYDGGHPPAAAATGDVVPLSVFDNVTYNKHVSGVYFFNPPAPASAVLEAGLARALAAHCEWAGRLGADAGGSRAILLSDAGARLVEATADVALSTIAPLETSPELPSLCPGGGDDDITEELMLIQVTRFACGSFAVGHTAHHAVADGLGRCSFMLAWGRAARGLAVDPVQPYDRASVFAPRNPPRVEFEHRGVEFVPRAEKPYVFNDDDRAGDEVVVHTVHFTPEMVSELKARASSAGTARPRPYSSLQCVAAHLWRCITKARGLDWGEPTKLKIAVNGRPRLRHPPVPEGYAGNVVLWALPATTVGELLSRPLHHAAELISRAVARVDESYFRSFVNFASSGAVAAEGLAQAETLVRSPDVFVSNLKGIPMYDLDLGTGRAFLFTRSHPPWEGYVFIMPPSSNDGSIDVQVGLFTHAMDIFKDCCYSAFAGCG